MKKILILTFLLFIGMIQITEAQRNRNPRHQCERERRFDGRGGRHECIRSEKSTIRDINTDSLDQEFGEFEQWEEETDTITNPESSIMQTPGMKEDLFGEFDEFEAQEANIASERSWPNANLKWVLLALGLTILAGFLVKYPLFRKYRVIVLIGSLIFFGFYLGGCPCPVSGIQNVILSGFGGVNHWNGLIWFLGLIPITYLFGKVWCGWVCHLGGLQELIYRKKGKTFLTSEKAQKTFKWVRISLLILLIAQLIITKSNLYKEIDPFKAAFNLYSGNIVTWILLALLIISSIFIYRPFCRSVCPVGLVLGWISKIPGASVVKKSDQCNACATCHRTCQVGAITREKVSKFNNEECIRCGECLDACSKNGLLFGHKKNKSNGVIELKKVA